MTTEEPNDGISRIETNLAYAFRDLELLKAALTHPSISSESKSKLIDNQRLEFLGDAVLQLSLTEALYRRFPDQNEGVLTKWRSRLVSKEALAQFATKLEIGSAMFLGRGEEKSGGRSRPSTLADCVEALLGAVYLDGGFIEADKVVMRMCEGALISVVQSKESGNPKGELQESLQEIVPESPTYEILSAEGPDHDRSFLAAVNWCGRELGRGSGPNKKIAEAAAAAEALRTEAWKTKNN